MKIRIKFTKTGVVKYVGHLDMMRYFQKLIRRANIDICYSEGFNPHQKMSFAAPLGVGVSGEGEYVDIEVNTTDSSEESVRRLNEASVEGIEIKSYRRLPEGVLNGMASVAAATYRVRYREGYEPDFSLEDKFMEFMNQETIEIEKETKKSTAVVDIKSMIYDVSFQNGVVLKLAAGSVTNLKPELVFTAFYQYLEKELPEFALEITRLEVYGNSGTEENPKFIPLEDFGEDIPKQGE